jgi:hypothetical protein
VADVRSTSFAAGLELRSHQEGETLRLLVVDLAGGTITNGSHVAVTLDLVAPGAEPPSSLADLALIGGGSIDEHETERALRPRDRSRRERGEAERPAARRDQPF